MEVVNRHMCHQTRVAGPTIVTFNHEEPCFRQSIVTDLVRQLGIEPTLPVWLVTGTSEPLNWLMVANY